LYDQFYQPLLAESRVEAEPQTFVPPGRNCFESDCGYEVAESGDQEDEVASGPQVMLTKTWSERTLRRVGKGLTWEVAIRAEGVDERKGDEVVLASFDIPVFVHVQTRWRFRFWF